MVNHYTNKHQYIFNRNITIVVDIAGDIAVNICFFNRKKEA